MLDDCVWVCHPLSLRSSVSSCICVVCQSQPRSTGLAYLLPFCLSLILCWRIFEPLPVSTSILLQHHLAWAVSDWLLSRVLVCLCRFRNSGHNLPYVLPQIVETI